MPIHRLLHRLGMVVWSFAAFIIPSNANPKKQKSPLARGFSWRRGRDLNIIPSMGARVPKNKNPRLREDFHGGEGGI